MSSRNDNHDTYSGKRHPKTTPQEEQICSSAQPASSSSKESHAKEAFTASYSAITDIVESTYDTYSAGTSLFVAQTDSTKEIESGVLNLSKEQQRRMALYGTRALAAGSNRHSSRTPGSSSSKAVRQHALTSFGARRRGELSQYIQKAGALSSQAKYLVVGDGLMAPFMALCLRVHGLECDLAHHPSNNDLDHGTITLTPSVTQLMGDVLGVSVPSGSVIGRILTFDHAGNDMCDIDLNEFRERGESPTFFCCDRLKVESALLSLCHQGPYRCHVLAKPHIDRGGLDALENGGVRVHFSSCVEQDYLGIICTARNQDLVPELIISNEELQQRAENSEKYKESFMKAVRWVELCVPPLPELGQYEKRFTPGSQEIVEILTPRDAKMTVRPTMMATKLFYNIALTIPDSTPDPRLVSTSTKQFWDDVITHWTSGIPGYISHTMFRPMFTHMQQNFTKSSALVFRTPLFLIPHWVEGGGRLIKVGLAAHGSCFDAIDVTDAQSFTDCFTLARAISGGEDITKFLSERRLQVMEEMDHHSQLVDFAVKERRQIAYMIARFNMKFLCKYKKSWRTILKNYITLMPKGMVGL